MPDITPAQLSLELNVSQKRVRSVLRELYGTLPEGTTRWELTDEQADTARSRIGRAPRTDPALWTLEPGDIVLRRSLHAAMAAAGKTACHAQIAARHPRIH